MTHVIIKKAVLRLPICNYYITGHNCLFICIKSSFNHRKKKTNTHIEKKRAKETTSLAINEKVDRTLTNFQVGNDKKKHFY